MDGWKGRLNGDPVPWLLAEDTPEVRAMALRVLEGRSQDDPEFRRARQMAMANGPIAAILEAQHPDGYWVKPGPGYSPKYRGTVWQLIFLDQLGADGGDSRVQLACEYVLVHTQAESGGFGCSYEERSGAPAASSVIHCLSGNLLRALVGFGRLDDERVQRAVEWQARSITGEGLTRYYQSSTSGPGFCCAANDRLPCAWGAVKALRGLVRVPEERRAAHVRAALRIGAEFLLGRDPAVADYPISSRSSRPSESWFKLGFPSGYVADVLQNLEVLCELGFAGDPRLQPAVRWLLSLQDGQGRWKNRYAYRGKTWVDIEKQGEASKWVTLRACGVLKVLSESTDPLRDWTTTP